MTARVRRHPAPESPGPEDQVVEEPPPVLGTWRRLYIAVLLNLAILVVLFHLFTRAFE